MSPSKTKLPFTKMQGAGNDYIYFNCFEQTIADPAALSQRLADRHFGVGGDGIVLIGPSAVADAQMRMFNADGSEGKMCGNAIRCVGKYLYENAIVPKTNLTVETLSGMKTLALHLEQNQVTRVTVDMGPAALSPQSLPVLLAEDPIIHRATQVAGGEYAITCVSMGNPHCVVFWPDVSTLPIETIGPKFAADPLFPESVNTEFVQLLGPRTIAMRVWERGSGETYACGTGACAAAVAAVLCGHCPMGEDITVKLLGGDLTIRYTQETVWMTGDATKVFDGMIEV